MAEEISKLITIIVDDLKLALDNLFIIIEDVDMEPQELARRLDQAKFLYNKHFVCEE